MEKKKTPRALMTREITYYVPGILLRWWGYHNEEGRNDLCFHVAKSFGEDTEKKLKDEVL